jgi:hypothetical protein
MLCETNRPQHLVQAVKPAQRRMPKQQHMRDAHQGPQPNGYGLIPIELGSPIEGRKLTKDGLTTTTTHSSKES